MYFIGWEVFVGIRFILAAGVFRSVLLLEQKVGWGSRGKAAAAMSSHWSRLNSHDCRLCEPQ